MALGSATPTQIGSTRDPSLSRRMTIGRLVAGSIMSVLTVISICIATSFLQHYGRWGESSSAGPAERPTFATQAVRIRRGDADRHQLADQRAVAAEVHHGVPARAPRELPVA